MKTNGEKIQEIVAEIRKSDPHFHEFIASQVLLEICGCTDYGFHMVLIDDVPASTVYHDLLAQKEKEKPQ